MRLLVYNSTLICYFYYSSFSSCHCFIRAFTMSFVVKDMATARGPFIQFIVNPLYSPDNPSVLPMCTSALTTEDVPFTCPCTCTRRRTISNGYVHVCANKPAKPPNSKRLVTGRSSRDEDSSIFTSSPSFCSCCFIFIDAAFKVSNVANEIPA